MAKGHVVLPNLIKVRHSVLNDVDLEYISGISSEFLAVASSGTVGSIDIRCHKFPQSLFYAGPTLQRLSMCPSVPSQRPKRLEFHWNDRLLGFRNRCCNRFTVVR